jgi:hypothetical protein
MADGRQGRIRRANVVCWGDDSVAGRRAGCRQGFEMTLGTNHLWYLAWRQPMPSQAPGVAIGSNPARSLRVTRMATNAMISASTMIPAATTKPFENPVASAWW